MATLLDDAYLRNLHEAMFDQVWEWAGRYRLREANIGIALPWKSLPNRGLEVCDEFPSKSRERLSENAPILRIQIEWIGSTSSVLRCFS